MMITPPQTQRQRMPTPKQNIPTPNIYQTSRTNTQLQRQLTFQRHHHSTSVDSGVKNNRRRSSSTPPNFSQMLLDTETAGSEEVVNFRIFYKENLTDADLKNLKLSIPVGENFEFILKNFNKQVINNNNPKSTTNQNSLITETANALSLYLDEEEDPYTTLTFTNGQKIIHLDDPILLLTDPIQSRKTELINLIAMRKPKQELSSMTLDVDPAFDILDTYDLGYAIGSQVEFLTNLPDWGWCWKSGSVVKIEEIVLGNFLISIKSWCAGKEVIKIVNSSLCQQVPPSLADNKSFLNIHGVSGANLNVGQRVEVLKVLKTSSKIHDEGYCYYAGIVVEVDGKAVIVKKVETVDIKKSPPNSGGDGVGGGDDDEKTMHSLKWRLRGWTSRKNSKKGVGNTNRFMVDESEIRIGWNQKLANKIVS